MFEFLSDAIIKHMQSIEVFCWNNGKPEHLKIIKNQYSSYQVEKFMTRIYYPPNSLREHGVVVYIHFIEYMAKKIIEEQKIEIKSFEDYKRVYDSVLNEFSFDSEVKRFYANWLRREDFKNARFEARIGKHNEAKVPNTNH